MARLRGSRPYRLGTAAQQVESSHHSRVEEHVDVRTVDIRESGYPCQLLRQEDGRSRSNERGNRNPIDHREVDAHLQTSDIETVPYISAFRPVYEIAAPTGSQTILAGQEVVVKDSSRRRSTTASLFFENCLSSRPTGVNCPASQGLVG